MKHEIGQVLAGMSFQTGEFNGPSIWRTAELQRVDREGRRQTEKSHWRERVGRGSLGQESMGEQAALLNFKDDHLKRTSAHIQITRLMWTNRIQKKDSSWESQCDKRQ